MPCVLRVSGKIFKVNDFIKKSKLKVCAIYCKGEKTFKSEKYRSKKLGINIEISAADFNDLEKQIKDAIKFLEKNEREIKKMSEFCGQVDGLEIDFGVDQRNVAVQCDRFPPKLLSLCGELGITLAISQYPKNM